MVREATSLRRTFADEPSARLATVGPEGAPHVVPAWFVWREDAIYCSTRQGSRTWLNAELDPRVSVVIDRGRDWSQLTGVVLEGDCELVAADDPAFRQTMSGWHQKYRNLLSGDGFERFTTANERLGFVRLVPERMSSWNHRDS
jgi:nitroimidazol reductase NimA-like FMN-containing flavoprotein (pyridoxamine 5'-phosphate oxidase superfamily)